MTPFFHVHCQQSLPDWKLEFLLDVEAASNDFLGSRVNSIPIILRRSNYKCEGIRVIAFSSEETNLDEKLSISRGASDRNERRKSLDLMRKKRTQVPGQGLQYAMHRLRQQREGLFKHVFGGCSKLWFSVREQRLKKKLKIFVFFFLH